MLMSGVGRMLSTWHHKAAVTAAAAAFMLLLLLARLAVNRVAPHVDIGNRPRVVHWQAVLLLLLRA
jgi:hypothetical protein